MAITGIMHVSFYTDNMEEMCDFYENKLGFKMKIKTKAKAYAGKKNYYGELAEKDPEKVIIVYFEIAPGQFIELFPKRAGQTEHEEWNTRVGYSHYSILVDDIFETEQEFKSRGIEIDTEISKGPSETYKFWIHDPDGNKIEVMQFTGQSYQIVGNIM